MTSLHAKLKQVREEPITVAARCAYEPCNATARIRVRKGSGYSDLCLAHYNRYFAAYAKKWCVDRGLLTREEKIAYCKRISKSIGVSL